MSMSEDNLTKADTPLDSGPKVLKAGESIEQFVIRQLIGRGGFGVVYLAYDQVLQRDVALKVPHHAILSSSKYADMYMAEARAIAALDHPNIIPVYQASQTPEYACYIVTKYVAGMHLGQWARQSDAGYRDALRVVALIADAIDYAHRRGIVHRDIKPSNVLIDQQGNPFVADFGLALRDAEPEDGLAYVGTAPYMSPEQARGEGHRLDGRSDIFSLGVVLYELLGSRRPFRQANRAELYHAIQFEDPTPLRELRSSIPRELERICNKAIAKTRSERYASAAEMAKDIRDFLESRDNSPASDSILELPSSLLSDLDTNRIDPNEPTVIHESNDAKSNRRSRLNLANSKSLPNSKSQSASLGHVSQWLPIVPKGLRSFDYRDADFFVQLLPGPRDREGLPEVIRFWQSRIEPTSNDEAPSVCVLFGPSGCGKSSLVKAGIIPRLSEEVIPVYVEATANGTEAAILEQLKQRTSLIPASSRQSLDSQLIHAFTWLRRNGTTKVVLFIDQFEQWLFGNTQYERQPLANALRQCDGGNLQCILMVRDDFWMGVTRLMQCLELTIVENQNSMAVDLFDRRHAKRVLAMFGSAYGRISSEPDNLIAAENRFLDSAVDYLATDNRVVCVQLALLAEILKSRPWNSREVSFERSGLGLGIRFLNDTFDSETSQRRLRLHAEAAARVLRRLLPESISRIKGSMHSEKDLIEASGYSDLTTFRELIRILDHELHLITPTERLQSDSFGMDSTAVVPTEIGFQLTHDFLITPIRQWVELRNLGTRLGQAQARLDEFAELYQARPQPQSLPTFLQFANLRWRIAPKAWTEAQRRMMRAAERLYGRYLASGLVGFLLLFVAALSLWNIYNWQLGEQQSKNEVARLLSAELSNAIPISSSIRNSNHQGSKSRLLAIVEDTKYSIDQRARAALVLAPSDDTSKQLLCDFLLRDQTPLPDAIRICRSELARECFDENRLKRAWNDKNATNQMRLRAALGLVQTQSNASQEHDELARLLINEPTFTIPNWMDGFAPCGSMLIEPLEKLFRSILSNNSDAKNNCVLLLSRFSKTKPELLASLVSEAEPDQLLVIVNSLVDQPHGMDVLRAQADAFEPRATPKDLWKDGLHIEQWRNVVEGEDVASDMQADIKLQELVKNLGVKLHSNSAVFYSLSRADLEQLETSLAPYGFRLYDVTSATIDGKSRFSGFWRRDGRRSRYILEVPGQELASTNRRMKAENCYPTHVSSNTLDQCTSFVYNCVWTEGLPLPIVVNADMYIEVPEDRHQADGWEPFNSRGFVPKSNLMNFSTSGQATYTSIRWRLKEPIRYDDKWSLAPSDLVDNSQSNPDALVVHGVSSLSPAPTTQPGVSTIWWSGPPFTSKWIEFCSAEEHARTSEQLFKSGFEIVSISAATQQGTSWPLYCSTWWRPITDFAREADEHLRQSRRLLALHMLGNSNLLIDALSNNREPELRASLIDAFHRHQYPSGWLLDHLIDITRPLELRRACGLALALYDDPRFKPVETQRWNDFLQTAQDQVLDPGLRSTVEAICSKWKVSRPQWPSQSIDEFQAVNGNRMIVIDSRGPVLRGSPVSEKGRDQLKEMPQRFRINRRFAIADREITVEQFKQFRSAYDPPKEHFLSDACPAIDVNWFLAVMYCRWLSEQEKIPEEQMCYPPVEQISRSLLPIDSPDYKKLELPLDFLSRHGYRLPTESEWELACRVGVYSARPFGTSNSNDYRLLNNYAWTFVNSDAIAHPVGQKLPNDIGLFDTLGNCLEWCHERTEPVEWSIPDMDDNPIESERSLDPFKLRAIRGGSFLHRPLDARSGQRSVQRGRDNRVYISFRIARTMMVLGKD